MRPYLLALIVIVAITLIACAPAPAPTPVPTDAPPGTGASPAAAPANNEPVLRRENADIRAIVDKDAGVKSMSFDIATLPDKGAWGTYYVRGDKARITLAERLDIDDWNADEVYVDYTAKTATARCINFASCKYENRRQLVEFSRYGIDLPTDWSDRVVYGERTGGLTFNSRQVSVIRWEEDDKTFEAYLDPFYGVVHRVAVIDLAQDPPTVLGGYEYRNLAYNTVKEEDVVEP